MNNKIIYLSLIVFILLVSSVFAYTYSKVDSDKLMVSYEGKTVEATPFEYLAVKGLIERDGFNSYSPADTFVNIADKNLIVYHFNNQVVKVIG